MCQFELTPSYRSVVVAEWKDVVSLFDEYQFRAVDLGCSHLCVLRWENTVVRPVRVQCRCCVFAKVKGCKDTLIGVVVS